MLSTNPVETGRFDLNLKHLRALSLVARRGSLSAASAEIGLSQSALTQAIGKLELQFGVRLFDRLAQGLRPTASGLGVLRRVDRMLDRLAGTVAALGAARPGARPESHLTATQIRALLSLEESGSLSGAAQALGISEPAVHRAVRDLERLCGTSLTERRGRGLALTAAARTMARGAMLAMNELDLALQEADTRPGQVSIGAMALSRSVLIPAALAEFAQRAPWARIDVVEGSFRELAEGLRSGRIDIVVGALRDRPVSGLTQEVLLHDRITVIGRSQHPLAGRHCSFSDLADYPWIVNHRASELLERWQRIFDDAGAKRPRAPIQCGSITIIRGLLVRSDFLTLLSRDQVTAELEAGLLVPIPSEVEDTPRTLGAIYRRDWLPSPSQRQFLDMLRQAALRLGRGEA